MANALELQAFMQAAQQAIVDNPRIVSMYETPASTSVQDGVTNVNETLVVLR